MKKNIIITFLLGMTIWGMNANIVNADDSISISEAKQMAWLQVNNVREQKKVNLSVGKSKQLIVSMKKVKWKSKNSKIAKVSKNGEIKGIKKGKTKIIAMSGKQKKVFVVKVKNSYYKANFKSVKKMMVRNLNNGQTKEFFGNDILLLQSKLNKNNFYRKITKDKLATGNFDYMFSLYDKNDKLLCSISFGEKRIVITKGKSSKKYICKKALDISHFEF